MELANKASSALSLSLDGQKQRVLTLNPKYDLLLCNSFNLYSFKLLEYKTVL